MKINHNIFTLPKPLFWLLAISNIAFAFWLESRFGSFWAWNITDLADKHAVRLEDILAVGQFVLFAVSVDMGIRHFVARFNQTTHGTPVPAILVQAVTIICYSIIGLFGFIAMYDHSAGQILAASGAIGFGIVYVMREAIADVVACIQIQSDGLISIGDQIQVRGDGGGYYEIVQMDRRMVTIKTVLQYTVRVPNRRFINMDYINLSKQTTEMGARRILELDLDSGNDADRVIELLSQAAEYTIKNDPNFFPWYRAFLAKINNGTYTFFLVYECNPTIPPIRSNGIVNLSIARFFKLGGINMNSTVEVFKSSEIIDTVKNRLKDVYRLGILKALSVEQVIQLTDAAQIVNCRANQHLIEKGHTADSMYILIEGSLEVTIPKDEEEVVVASIWPGDCVGEMSLLTGEPRSANVRAKVNSTLLEITKANIAPIFETHPELIEEISAVLEKRKAANQILLNKTIDADEVEKDIKALAKKILKFFFNKG
ncbi:mechanosensitive ion channel family protein [Polynucleobacter sp. AP-Latsch-80-C2]|jgi:CRP-like cAMP-binding protein/small-conductance mechanosensitive channel|uniref:mechanosensitive ion channel family protein n=1 Tax=Polynucleobacter sp. AP-Latsch-80-C2 TaxID=2576931 RepID=UPI001C0E79F4|nr:mechanosensitive ion channel family protein [Polynucleobacter sp. AP-Latsch-80-C2]MBU3623819.1 mechanosensitive ion channel family protein [Polynucleobacter sp. AP-Latsch-80-C2]